MFPCPGLPVRTRETGWRDHSPIERPETPMQPDLTSAQGVSPCLRSRSARKSLDLRSYPICCEGRVLVSANLAFREAIPPRAVHAPGPNIGFEECTEETGRSQARSMPESSQGARQPGFGLRVTSKLKKLRRRTAAKCSQRLSRLLSARHGKCTTI